MQNNQKLSPKYWIGHDKNSDDVIISSADKSYRGAEAFLINVYGEDYEEQGYEIKCIEVRFVTDDL